MLLKAGADRNLKFNGKTSAQWAAEKGHKEVAALFDQSEPAATVSDLAFRGEVKRLEQCIASGANIDEPNENGWTPLMFAANQGHKAAVDLLLSRKANVNHTAHIGCFPLWNGAFYGHKEVCETLLSAGADQTMKFRGKTAAQWAVDRGHKQLAALIDSWSQV